MNAESNKSVSANGSAPRFRVLRFLGFTAVSVIAIYLLAVAALVFLARGGEDAYVWSPTPTPNVGATGDGSFDVTIAPDMAAIDVPVSIVVEGLEPGATTLLIMSTEDARGVRFESWAEFVADKQGRLALDETATEAGTYKGTSSNGLLWSMRAADGSLFHTSEQWENREYTLSVISSGLQTDLTFERRYPFTDVSRKQVGGERWKGELTVPNRDGPFPVIIALAGWGDGPMKLTSALLANRGFAVLNVGYHGWEGLPEELVEIPVECVIDAIDWLAVDSEYDAHRVGVLGISKGAELALIAASRDSRINAVAAWVPSSRVFAGISQRSIRQRSSWTWGGQPLPFARTPVNKDTLRVTAKLMLRRPTSFRPIYAAALAESDNASEIPIEKITGQILLVAGAKDLIWPSADMSQHILDRADNNPAGQSNVTALTFDEAGHSVSFSLWPVGDFTERQLIRGGSPEANHLAGQVAWKETLELFTTL